MHSSIVVLSAFLSSVMGQAVLGGTCTSSSQCPTGVQCYSSRSGLQTLCGNTGATCASNADCAFTACVSGACLGDVLSHSSSAAAVSTTITPTPTSASVSASATATGTALALGAVCTSTSQCASGVQCYASSSMAVAHCGNFGATCSKDAECAYNSCISGSCSGTLSSSLTSSYLSTLTSSASLKSTTSTSSPSATANGGNMTITTTGVPAGFTTSVTVVNGITSSLLVNSAGVTTSFGAVQTIVSVTPKGSDAGSLAVGMGGVLAVAGVVAILL